LLSRVKVIYQDQKDFNNKLRTYDMIWCLMNTHKNLLTL
jgi:hypothetical protein